MNTTPVERFRAGYADFPFGTRETMVPGAPEYKGWTARCRESMRKDAPRVGPYKPRISGSDAAVLTVIRFLGD